MQEKHSFQHLSVSSVICFVTKSFPSCKLDNSESDFSKIVAKMLNCKNGVSYVHWHTLDVMNFVTPFDSKVV